MRCVKYIPREIFILAEYSMRELMLLEIILRNSQFDYNGEDPIHVEAKDYLEQKLYPNIKKTLKEVTEDVA